MYVAAALSVVIIAGVLVLILSNIGILGGDKGEEVANASTRVPTHTPTPTMTPTPGGNTPTPFPVERSVFASPTVSNLGLQGNVYAATPTAIYPELHANIRQIQGAIDLYSIGAYDNALGTLEAVHGQVGNACYQNLVYYEAMSQAGLQDYDAASELLLSAINSTAPARSNFCQNADSALLYSGLAYVRYLEGNYAEAISFGEQARGLDRDLIDAVVVLGRAYTSQGDYQNAWRVLVEQGLERWPRDVNLRIAAAENELFAGNPESALEHLGVAVYLNPAAMKVLDLQSRVYLALADKTPNTEELTDTRLQYYGLAVLSAQTMLLYYPGEPAGYLYLAQARLGEGNLEQAETALTRIIELEETLPANAGIVIDMAFKSRGNLYYYQGRLESARSDFRHYLALTASQGADQDVVQKLIDIALGQKDYAEAVTQLDELLALDPTNPNYLLVQARIRAEICTFAEPDLCEYADTLQLLNDEFVVTLTEDSQRAAAYSYRAQAQYWETQSRRSLSDEERTAAYQTALNDINQAVQLREVGVDHYYRGLLLQELGMLSAALEEFRWLGYWNEAYAYSFIQEDLDEQANSLEDDVAATATAFAVTAQPTETPTVQGAAPRPTATASPTMTPTITVTPAATPTQPQIP
jgi:tetratricopeptide (TPR) repeat protein